VLGAAETVVGLTDAFEPARDQRGLYLPAEIAQRTVNAAGARKKARNALARAR